MSNAIETFNTSIADLLKGKNAQNIAEALKKRREPEVSSFDLEAADLLSKFPVEDIATILTATDPGTVAWFDDNNNNNNKK